MLKIICVGSIKEKEMTLLINEYLKRLKKYTKIEIIELPDYSYDLKNTIKHESNLILKNTFARPRPCDIDTAITLLLSRPHGHSFPSGHSINSMVAAVALFLNNKKIGVPAVILATLIGFSRMYLFVHFPTDVLGGFVIAILVAVAVDFAFQKIKFTKIF